MKKIDNKKTTDKKSSFSKKPQIKREAHKLDATGLALGRLATKISIILRGKNKPDFQPNIDNGDIIFVTNASKIKFSGKKLEQKIYYHYSGFQSGLKRKKASEIFEKNPSEILKRAVWNMLPKNKLRNQMFKRLKITN